MIIKEIEHERGKGVMRYALTHCNILDGTKEMNIQEDMTVIVEESQITSI